MKKILIVVLLGVILSACSALPTSETKVASATPTVQSVQPTYTALPTYTPYPTQVVPATTVSTAIVATVAPAAVVNQVTSSNDWTITWFSGADFDRGDGTTFRQDAEKWTWREIAPELWPTFPNIPNPLVPDFRVLTCADDPSKLCVPDGLEYANPESNFCQQLAGEACRVPVATRHYFYFTGDYNVPNIGSCEEGGTGYGCMLVIVNNGDVTRDITGVFNQGFRLHARYFNGKALDMAIWALTSQGSNAMMNLSSTLNPNGFTNAGGNCSVPTGCHGVNVRVVFVSGNEPLLMLETKVSR